MISPELAKRLRARRKLIADIGFDRVVGTSGTILSLGAVAAAERGGTPEDLRNLRVSSRSIHRLRRRTSRPWRASDQKT